MAIKHQYDDDETESLIINVHPELRKRLTLIAAQNDMSVQEYVEELLEQAVTPEPDSLQEHEEGLDLDAIEDLFAYRDELQHAHPDVVFDDSVELLHQIREERMRELEQR